MFKFLKKPVVIFILTVIVIVGGYFYFSRGDEQQYEYVEAKKGTVIQEVSVTGRVKAAQDVDLAFEKSGKISRINVKVGDKVRQWQTLVSLENADVAAQLAQVEASLAAEQSKLDEMKKGTRPEEIQQAETKVGNAERVLSDAQTDLVNVKNKAAADLESDYNAGLSATQEAVTAAKNSLIVLTDIQFSRFTGSDSDSMRLADAKKDAVEALLGAANAGRATALDIGALTGGAFGKVSDAARNPTHEKIDTALTDTISALQKVRDALDAVPISTSLTSTEKTNLSTEKASVDTELTVVSGKQQDIAVQKATNAQNISDAEAAVTTARNTLLAAQDDLNLKCAGYTTEQLAAQEAKVKSANANVLNYQAQLAKTLIRAPFVGTVTKQNARVGEIVAANTALVSMISDAKFEIEANIPEADIAKVKIGDVATVTLDAYGSDAIFDAQVSIIEQSETFIEGVATYKTTLQFAKDDGRIKSGMTADLDILTAKRENVLVVPQRAVAARNGDRFVKILKDGNIEEVAVKTGIKGSDGNIEISEGINEGDKVIIFLKEQ